MDRDQFYRGLHLERHDPARNLHRAYGLQLARSLFGHWGVQRAWAGSAGPGAVAPSGSKPPVRRSGCCGGSSGKSAAEAIFADRVYCGDQLLYALADCGPWTIEIVKRSEGVKGFQLLPRRWVVERTFAWLGKCRRLAKGFEATIATETAWIFLAHIRLLSRRLAKA